jgi:hypothetical protein
MTRARRMARDPAELKTLAGLSEALIAHPIGKRKGIRTLGTLITFCGFQVR